MDRLAKLEREEKAANESWETVHGKPIVDVEDESDAGTDETQVLSEGGNEGVVVQGEASPDDQKLPDQTPAAEPPKTLTKEEKLADENSETWANKYRTIEGKYRAEVPRLNQEVKQWKEHAIALNGRISELETSFKKTQSEAASAESNQEIEKLSTEYPDIGKVIKKINDDHRAELQALEERLTKGVATELDSVKQNIVMTKKDKFDMAMRNAGIDDWASIDSDPGFLEFLKESPTPYTKKTKHDFLLEAADAFDIPRVSKIFKEYKDAVNTPPAPVKDEVQERLEQFISPPKGAQRQAPASVTKPTYTRDDYTAFMKETSKGKFDPAKWGGKTEEQVEAAFDRIIAAGQLG